MSSRQTVRSSHDPVASPSQPTRARSESEEGYTLAALIVLMTIISIIIAYTVPQQWSLVMRRERERQTIFLMKQYARAINAWQTKHQSPPNSLEQLQDARKPRMIRGTGQWPCPLTGNVDDWILVPPTAILPGGGAPLAQGNLPGGGSPTQPPRQPDPGQPAPGQPALAAGSRLNPEASPEDYEGPFIAVRPRAKGKSMIALNGAENYEEWVFTVADLQAEIQARRTAASLK
ncbi:MAG TPA: type II secretion system protein [Thermoanaerobaculia bacterium]